MNNDIGEIMQLGYIVENVEAAAAQWCKEVGVGPFYVLEHLAMDQYYYRGKRVDVELRLAFAYWGNVQVELIQQLNDADSFYSHAVKTSPGALNHCATVVSDIDSILATRQLQNRVVHSGAMPTGLKFVYLENYLPGGLHLELIEAQASTLQAFSGMQAVAQHWDGKNPVRSMANMADDIAALG